MRFLNEAPVWFLFFSENGGTFLASALVSFGVVCVRTGCVSSVGTLVSGFERTPENETEPPRPVRRCEGWVPSNEHLPSPHFFKFIF